MRACPVKAAPQEPNWKERQGDIVIQNYEKV